MPVGASPERVGVRTWLLAALAALATFDPSTTLLVGPAVAAVVFITGRPSRLRMSAPVILAALFALWCTLSILWSRDPDFTKATAILWAQLLVIFIALHDAIKSRAQLRLIVLAYLAGAVSTVVKNLFTAPDAAALAAATAHRVELGNANTNYIAYTLGAGFALVVLLWMLRKNTKAMLLVLVPAIVLIVVGINLTETRAAFIGMGFLVAWIVLSRLCQRPPIKFLVFVLLALQVLAITGITDRASLIFETGSRATGDWSGRLVVWPIAREVWGESPLIGIGAGGFRATNPLGIPAHNMVLQTGTGLGLVGVVLLVALIWTAVSWSSPIRQPRRAFIVGAFLAASAPAYLTGVWETAPASWVVLAIISKVGVLDLDAETAPPAPKTTSKARRYDAGRTLVRSSDHGRLVPGYTRTGTLPPNTAS